MRYTITRLCGGEAIMLIPRDSQLDLDLDTLADALSDNGFEVRNETMMIVMNWKQMEVTIYEAGKIMFHPLKDSTAAIEYANEIMHLIK